MAQLASYTNFSGGVHQRLPQIIVDKDAQQRYPEPLFYCEDASNFETSTNGLIKFKGYENVLASAISGATITGLFSYSESELIACASNGRIYRISSGTATQIHTGATSGTGIFWRAEMFNGLLLMCNGTDAPLQYNGTTVAAVTFTDPDTIWSGARPKDICIFKNRVFWVGDTTRKSRIFTPKAGTHNDFTVANGADAFDVEVGYGGDVIAMRPIADEMAIIWKQRVTRGLTGSNPFASTTDPFSIGAVSDDVGCVATRSVVNVGKDYYFLAHNGYRTLKTTDKYGNVEVEQPSYLIQDFLNQINQTDAYKAVACYSPKDNAIYLSIPSGSNTQNDKTYVFHVISKAIQPRAGFNVASAVYYKNDLYIGDYAGQICKMGYSNTFGGTAQTGFWKSKLIAHDGMMLLKNYRKIVIFAEADGAAQVNLRYRLLSRGVEKNYSKVWNVAGGSLWGTMVWGDDWSGSTSAMLEIKNLGKGQAIGLEFINNLAQQIKIRQIDIYYDTMGAVKG